MSEAKVGAWSWIPRFSPDASARLGQSMSKSSDDSQYTDLNADIQTAPENLSLVARRKARKRKHRIGQKFDLAFVCHMEFCTVSQYFVFWVTYLPSQHVLESTKKLWVLRLVIGRRLERSKAHEASATKNSARVFLPFDPVPTTWSAPFQDWCMIPGHQG